MPTHSDDSLMLTSFQDARLDDSRLNDSTSPLGYSGSSSINDDDDECHNVVTGASGRKYTLMTDSATSPRPMPPPPRNYRSDGRNRDSQGKRNSGGRGSGDRRDQRSVRWNQQLSYYDSGNGRGGVVIRLSHGLCPPMVIVIVGLELQMLCNAPVIVSSQSPTVALRHRLPVRMYPQSLLSIKGRNGYQSPHGWLSNK